MTMIEIIEEYVAGQKVRVPIYTEDIQAYVLSKFPTVKLSVINEYINRFEKRCPDFVRYKKGVYYRTVKTPFGYATMDIAEFIRREYLVDGTSVVGYETGPSYMNKLGLTTQIPRFIYLATNHKKARFIDENLGLYLLDPLVTVNEDNYKYLRLLDIMANKFKVEMEHENPISVYRQYIIDNGLNYETLLHYAVDYKNTKLFTLIAQTARRTAI